MKKFFTTEVLIFLLLINTALHYMNFRFEKVDLPNATKKLVIDTIKNEIDFNAKCVNENCRKEIKNLENVLDEISYANQLGRLDTISLLLALFGLILGFGAVAGFMHIKENAERTAADTAKEWFKKNGEDLLKRNPELLQKIVEKVLEAEKSEKESKNIDSDIAKQDWS